jgi:MYXO-CTERM domain-containing protein
VSGFRSFLAVTAMSLMAGVAHANPYASQILRTRAVPGPHIQITYAVEGGMASRDVGMLASNYGSKQTPWRSGSGYRADTGSGTVSLGSLQSCDCYVPRGVPLEYRMTVKDRAASAMGMVRDMTLTSTVTVGDTFDSAVETDASSVTDARLAPDARWQSEPTGVQGLDCMAACLTDQADASTDAPMSTISDAALVTSDVPVTAPVSVPDAQTVAAPQPETTSRGSKGCAIGHSAPQSGLALVALLALLVLRRRRR